MIATRSPSATLGHAGADRDDVARELVPEDLRVLRAGQRVRLDGRDDRPGDVLVQVGAADAAGRDAHDDLAGARLGAARRRPRSGGRARRGSAAPASSRHDPLGPQAREQVGERGLGVADAVEPEPPARAHVGERLDRAAEVGVRVPPRGERVDVECRAGRGAGRSRGQISPASAICCSSGAGSPSNGTGSTPSAAASRGHSRRQRKTSPLTMLSAWFAARRRRRRPDEVLGEQLGVGDVGDRLPLLAASPGSGTAAPGLAADRRRRRRA